MSSSSSSSSSAASPQKRKLEGEHTDKKKKKHAASRQTAPVASELYWLLHEISVAETALAGWNANNHEYPQIKPGVFELVVHPLSHEDEDPHQGKILVCCAQCRDFYNKKRPASIDIRTFAWAVGGCQGRKVKALQKHLDSEMHRKSATKLLHEEKHADMVALIDDAHQAKRDTMEQLFRTIYYLAKTNRPLSDYIPLRNLQVRNGLEEMDLSPLLESNGVLNQASAN
jgi:hypothetical protein